ncbi:BTAD domain-containing putative transcriptional regulator [Phytoactinopolyspora mesophila]|uniref:LysM peptidoglycan-binding domain-containing protein n=1 Tax=Phytoactinopolyspora mesophila TaxID=2650750 RepID=A0A7K3M158_9ACTN|nr:BTAD domain-containing putative transcriptional regulator [Phytoactinopolyspora mesophila]NDL57033.1 LysM peptidoglycan-binding domain-containing protein [Phytoactinopolyspora mesophila]
MTGTSQHARGAEVLRGLLALFVLSSMLGAIPYGLWRIGGRPWPSEIPNLDEVTTALTRPDDGSMFISALLIAGWIGWAAFAIAVLVEVPAALRGVRAPKIPALGAQQRIAAVLVSAVLGMLAVGPAAMAGSPSAATTMLVAAEDWRPVPPVRPAELETEPPVPDAPLDESEESDGTGPETDTHDVEEADHSIHRVERGDTLWDIAGEHLDDPTRWPEIAEASADTIQPDGRRLTNPDLIYPGWNLTVPIEVSDLGQHVPDTGEATTSGDDVIGSDATTPSAKVADARTPVEPHATMAATAEDCEDPAADELSPDELSQAGHGEETDADSDVLGVVRTTAGVGALLAAGVIALLTTRRALRQRHRKPGQRLVPPGPVGTAAEIELRHVADLMSLEFIDRALRMLARNLAEQHRAPPIVRAARLAHDQFELHLDTPAPAPEPWVSTDDDAVWMLTPDRIGSLVAGEAEHWPAPYPSLVTIGHDADDAHILLDLEHIGMLHVSGNDDNVRAFMAALAAEYATSRLADDVQITLVDHAVSEPLQTGRTRRVDPQDVSVLVQELTARAQLNRDLVQESGVSSLTEARTRLEGEWTPEIVLVATQLNDQHWTQLARLSGQKAHAAIAVVTNDPTCSGEWTIRVASADEAILEPWGVTLRPQQINRATEQQVADLIASADAESVGAAQAELGLHEIPLDEGEDRTELALHPSGGQQESDGTPGLPQRADMTVTTVEHPRILLLGEPDVIGAFGPLDPSKRGQAVQVAAYLALRPGRRGVAMDEAIWPGRRQASATRATAVSTLRRWLGAHPSGQAYLPPTTNTYALHPAIRSDWDDWRELLRDGPQSTSTENLQQALDLVRARPLSGVRSGSYAWADMHVQEMIAEIVDACHELAERALRNGDFRGAQRAALRGLDIEPGCELLWRDRLKAETRLGTRASVLALIAKLRDFADELGGDLEDESVALIEEIERSTTATSRS